MLRVFDLDAPLAAKETRNRFRWETRCVTALFERCFKNKQRIKKIWKVLVDVVDSVTISESQDYIGVLRIQVAEDVHSFLSMDIEHKKHKTLEILMEGIRKIANEREWKIEEFERAQDEVRKRGFVNEWVWRRPIKNPAGTLSAELLVEHDVYEVRFSVRFLDRQKTIKSKRLLSEIPPTDFIFVSYLGDFRWLNDDAVELVSRDGHDHYVTSFAGEEVEKR